jgi:glucosyl-dolichyl phosphate glucuronosyltransferase
MSQEDTALASEVTVVVCAFTAERLELTCAAVEALRNQATPPEVLLVVDHNHPLLLALSDRLPGVQVLANEGPKGLSGGRNTGLRHARTPIVAFVDDDAVAQPGWTEAIVAPFADPEVEVVGGLVEPAWSGDEPLWFPPELLWAVGCTYRGMVTEGAVRNPLGANMAFRTGIALRAGEFDPALGRVGHLPFGCEETELCVRIRRIAPRAKVIITPAAIVRHHVPAERSTVRYVMVRSYYLGVGKAMLRRRADSAALGTERAYARQVLPRALQADIAGIMRGQQPRQRAKRLFTIGASLALAGVGYGVGYAQNLRTRPTAMETVSSDQA